MQKDEGLSTRIDALEKRLSDEDLSQIINLRVDHVTRGKIGEM